MKKMVFVIAMALVTFVNATTEGYTDTEKESLQLAKKFIYGKQKSFYSADGAVTFLHGGAMSRVLTAPLRLTDIQLEEGETIRELQAGDTVRWQISPSVSGSESGALVSHVIVKPVDAGLETTLNIFTDRRTYHINLKSTDSKYIPLVKFAYLDNLKRSLDAYNKKVSTDKSNSTMAVGGINVNISNLDFNYRIEGSSGWKPTRVFNDGRKTYIQMPSNMNTNEAPVLLVLDGAGNEKIVNYRLVGDSYVVDKLFGSAILIMGVGSSQEKVSITKSNKSNNFLKSLGF